MHYVIHGHTAAELIVERANVNKELAKKNIKDILELLAKIRTRLDEINDGSFYVLDLATKEIEEF